MREVLPTHMLPWLIREARLDVQLAETNRMTVLAHYGMGTPQAGRAGTEVVSRRRKVARLQERLRLSRHC